MGIKCARVSVNQLTIGETLCALARISNCMINTPSQYGYWIVGFIKVCLPFSSMFGRWVVFFDVIRFVELTRFPIDIVVALFHVVADPVKMHIHCLGFMLPYIVIHNTVCCGIVYLWGVPVFGWWCFSLINVVRIGMPSCLLKKNPPNSASAADATNVFIILHRMCIGLFGRGY